MKKLLPVLAFVYGLAASADSLKTGTYDLKGFFRGVSRPYSGTVVVGKDGGAYRLAWIIGKSSNKQYQMGTGLVDGEILSVMYFDGANKDVGVMTYRIEGSVLKGRWISQISQGFSGEEELTFRSAEIPEEYRYMVKPFSRSR